MCPIYPLEIEPSSVLAVKGNLVDIPKCVSRCRDHRIQPIKAKKIDWYRISICACKLNQVVKSLRNWPNDPKR